MKFLAISCLALSFAVTSWQFEIKLDSPIIDLLFSDDAQADNDGMLGPVPEGSCPWMATLMTSEPPSVVCSGSILNTRSVLTAAHCLFMPNSDTFRMDALGRSLRMIVGTTYQTSGVQALNISDHKIHPQYDPVTFKNDIGMLKTASPIIMSDHVRPIPISFANAGDNIVYRSCGWGGSVRLRTVDSNRCRSELARVSDLLDMRVPPFDPDTELCTVVDTNSRSCNVGDGSGVVDSNGTVIGIISWGLACSRGGPVISTRASAYRNWLELF